MKYVCSSTGAIVMNNLPQYFSFIYLSQAQTCMLRTPHHISIPLLPSQSVPANIVGTAAGTFPIADISVYNSTPVGKAGASIKKVTEAAPPQVQSYLKQASCCICCDVGSLVAVQCTCPD